MKNLTTIAGILLSCMVFFPSCGPNNIPEEEKDTEEYAYIQQKSAKRGVSFSWQLDEDFDLLGPAVSWSYNWAGTPASVQADKYAEYGINFVPMCWNSNYNSDAISSYYASTAANERYLLGFNEPNLTDQANMTPAQAAAYWDDVVALAKKNNAKLISPAVNWGTLAGYSNGVEWLSEFFQKVNPDDIAGIAVHIYMNAAKSTLGDLNRYKVFGKPLWLTEFCAWDGCSSSAAQCQFMTQCINSLEQDKDVARYAWFIPRWNQATESAPFMQLLTKTKPFGLTERGYLFVHMSSFDQTCVYPSYKRIPAEHYRACSVDENFSSPFVAQCTDTEDTYGRLQIDGLAKGQTVDYKINIDAKAQYLKVRYTATRESAIGVYCLSSDGEEQLLATISLPVTGGKANWKTIMAEVDFPRGEQIIRLRCENGLPRLNWFVVK